MADADSAQPVSLADASGRTTARWLLAAGAGIAAIVFAVWIWTSRVDPPAPADVQQTTGQVPLLAPDSKQAAGVEIQTYANVLNTRSTGWRLARLAENPKILLIEFPDLATQGRALNRLAALIEKYNAPRDHVLSDEGLAQFIRKGGDTPETFYFGHDYPAEAIARFFTMAVSQQMRLNPDEIRFGNELLAAGLLKEESDKLVANPDREAVVSFTAIQADDPTSKADETVDARRREAILRHELSHGEFFTNAAYRQHCWTFWQQLSDNHRSLLIKFLTAQGYDPRNEELMVNETQAYLMHTPDSRAFGAAQLGITPEQLAQLQARFRTGIPPTIFPAIER